MRFSVCPGRVNRFSLFFLEKPFNCIVPYSAKYSREKTFANLPRNELREENFRDRQGPTYDVCENLKFRGRKLSRREKNREIRESFLPRIFCAIRYFFL